MPVSIQDVRPRRLLLGAGKHVAGIDAKIGDLRLKGKDWKANVTDAVTAATLERTIEGASTVIIGNNDEHGKLRNHKLLESRFDVELSEMFFRFVAASRQGSTLSLTFEDRDVARLRQMKGPKKAFRDKVTRAEFVLMLLQEVPGPPIPAWIPELHIEQPIEDAAGARSKTNVQESQGQKGIDPKANLTVKGVHATPAQIKIGQTILSVGASMGAPANALIASIAATIQETGMANLPNQGAAAGGSTGVFMIQVPGTASAAVASDVAASAKWWFGPGGGVALGKKGYNPTTGPPMTPGGEGGIAQGVENSGFPTAYHQWEPEARKWVDAFGGGGSVTTTRTIEKRYAFERKKNEDSWTCIQRLAAEVKWRAFISNGLFYYVAEPDLLSAKIEMRVSDEAPGIDDISWDWDMGKKVAEISVTGRAKAWAAGPGTVADVNDQGPANGRYIVSNIQSNLFDDNVTVTLKRPTKPLPEPAPETTTKTTTKNIGTGGTGDGQALVKWAKKYVGTQEGSKLQVGWAQEFGLSPSLPWCSIFVAAGIRAVTDLTEPSNPAYSGAWLSWSGGQRVSADKRQPGDILVFDWGDGGITDHVGICIGGGQMISGNYGDQVSQSDDRSSSIVGVVRPNGF